MTINILFSASSDSWRKYEGPLRVHLNQLKIEYQLQTNFAPEIVDYIVYAPNSGLNDFSPYNRCKAVLNLWAGVENICLLYTSPSPRDKRQSRMPSWA